MAATEMATTMLKSVPTAEKNSTTSFQICNGMASINGLILSGGKSLRMGQDKGMIPYHGKPQREHLFELLTGFCEEVYTSCKSAQQIPASLHPLIDRYELDSPLNGIMTAFNHIPAVAWLTVPVDMPMIDRTIIKHLIDHRDEKKFATCFYDSDGEKPEPLLALWEPRAHLPLENFFNAGEFSPRKFLMKHDVHLIHAPSASLYQNINTPEELDRFLKQE